MTNNAFSAHVETSLMPTIYKGAACPAPPAGHLLRLYSAAPSDAGGGTELSGGGYAPIPLAGLLSAPTVVGGAVRVTNAARIVSPVATAAWPTATHYGITDAAGTLLVWAALSSPRAILTGQKWVEQPGKIVIDLAGTLAESIRIAVMGWLFAGQTISPTAITQLALYDASNAEITGGGYSRQPMTLGALTDRGDGTRAYLSTVAVDIVPSGNWGMVSNYALMTASGAQITYAPLDPAAAYANGDIFHIDAGDLAVILG